MAASANSSSSSSPPPPARPYTGKWEHDVFLCFRGDTRLNFMSHLREALREKQIRFFVDTMLTVTEDINELLSVLGRSAVSVVIFSEKFADSTWCLDEVDTIVRSVDQFGHRVLPVFYRVDWTAVAGDSGAYAKTIAELVDEDATEERKQEWKDALKAVAHKTGRTSEAIPDDAELVKQVVEDVLSTLAAMSSSIQSNNLVGMDSRVLEVERRLAMSEVDTIRIVGLRGMGGVGKTTLARACYEKLRFSAKDTKFHFVERIGENCDKQYAVDGFVQELYSALLSENYISHGDLNIGYRRARLSRLRVFIVLDDVHTPSQLEQLLLREALHLTKLFAAGSRIIVTTRNQRVLEYAKAEIHIVDHLSDDESLQLFKLHAFRPGSAIDDRIDLSHQVISYCNGNPLALKVLGGTLLPKDRKYWRSFLQKLSEIQEPEIHHVLRRSYDELGDDDKRLFLDIACSFYGIVRSLLIKYMEASYTSAYSRVDDLIDRSLLISVFDQLQGEVVVVHQLLREMAWNIVNEEKNVGKRSRLKNPDDIHNLLTIWKGDRETQGIHLDLSKAERMHLKANAFEGMDSLRWLEFAWPKCFGHGHHKIQLSDDIINSLPNELRGLYWDQFPSTSLPSGFSLKKLVYLILSHSPIEICWERDQPKLEHLMLLDLTYCENLTIVPNLLRSSHLEHLLLRGCKTLVELPASIQSLVKLVRLDARDCQDLQRVPARLNSKFLKQLLLSNCPKVTRCPEVNSGELRVLDLDGTPINSLPNAIYKVKAGGVLSLYGPNITSFPKISTSLELLRLRNTAIEELEFDHLQGSDLPRFDRLHLVRNSQLKTLPKAIWKMVSVALIVEDCPLIDCLPEISEPLHLTRLRIAGCARITDVSSCISNMKSLDSLVLPATGIKSLPSIIQELDQLSYLDLSYCTSLESIPNTIHKLARLSELSLVGCKSICSLPKLPPNLNILKANNCDSLQVLPSNIGNLSFQHLRFDDCPHLDRSSLDEIVANFPDQALSQHSQVGFHYSGIDIPEWFDPPNMEGVNNYVTLELPMDCSELKGVAFGVVYSLDQSCGSMSILCGCFIETEMITYWRSFSWNFHVLDSSDRVYLWSGDRFGKSKKDEEEEEEASWYQKYAGLTVSFRFFADKRMWKESVSIVMICFWATDTCHGFTVHLKAALSDRKIKAAFNAMLQKADCIDELLPILQNSALSIVIFSENFASSPCCLDQVATIARSMKDFGHVVLPVFCNVDWSDVVEDSGIYAAAVDALDATGDRKKRWRDALKEVADVAGFIAKQMKFDSELIKAIVENVMKKLNDMPPNISYENMVGMDSRVKEVEQLLALNTSDDIRIIGLWGMGGLGKTTLARRCYKILKSSAMEEHRTHFVERVGANWENQYGFGGLVQELYSILLSEKDLSRGDLNNIHRRARLSRLRVFLVLDDVQTSSQLEQLLLGEVLDLTKLFAPGSRIIMTTRDRSVLKYAMAKIYPVECLDSDESLRLFGMFAFRGKPLPSDEWMHLLHLAVSYCKGNPLALRVLGGALFCQQRDYWRDLLGELGQIQNLDVHHLLRKSFDMLAADEQRLFLDVACFHSGMQRSALIKYMATSYPLVHDKVNGLVYKSLLCVSNKEGEMIEVHDLLKEMAWSIINGQLKLENRSRLEDPDDVHKLLANQRGKAWKVFGLNLFKAVETYWEANDSKRDRTVEGICLDLSKVKEMELKGNAFKEMKRLRFLKFWSPKSSSAFPIHRKILLPHGGLNSLPDGLTCLHWDGYPSTSLPSTFSPENLVRIVIRHSPIEKCWAGVQPNLVNLLLLDLSCCINLTAIPDLSRSSNLEELLLKGCKSLVEIPSDVQHLDKLTTLDIRDCINLESLPAKFDSSFLKLVELSNCPKISHCPEMNSTELDLLDLDGTPIRELPSAIHKLKRGATLHLCGKNISSFPNISASLDKLHLCCTVIVNIDFNDDRASSELLPRFRRLVLVRNSQLKNLPSCIWKMVSTELIVQGSPLIESLPEISDPVEGFTRLVIVGGTSIKSVPSSISKLKSLVSLSFSGTAIKFLPSCIQELQHLTFLDFSYCKGLQSVPSDIHKLSSLAALFLRGCWSIRSLPQLPLKLGFLDVGDCTSLESLPSNILELMSWCGLIADGCRKLDRNFLDRVIAHLPELAARSPRSEAIIIYSRSELPESFCYNHVYGKEECCVTMNLPAANFSKGLVKGIAFGIVCSYSGGGFVDAHATLDCSIVSETTRGWIDGGTSQRTTISSWRFPLEILFECSTLDLVYLRADNRLRGTKDAEQEVDDEEEAWYVKYAGREVSFRLYTRAAGDETSVEKFENNFRIRRFGIYLVYS
ncbi:unnamed protein product [Linum trigynum]|uniref:TIR domain-containing protein n=1 Tax=Linum trigynum TaxID=586398 RepID=A0AAV2FYM5_9ROSI